MFCLSFIQRVLLKTTRGGLVSVSNLVIPVALLLAMTMCGEVSASEPYERVLDKMLSKGTYPLSLTQFIDLVVDRNQQLQAQDAGVEITRQAVNVAGSVYEPALVGGYNYSYINEQNDSAQFASRGFNETYEQKVHSYKIEVEGLVLTGAQYRLGYALSDSEDDITDIGEQYRQRAYLNLTQPLLKNFGTETTDTQVQLARKDVEIAQQEYRRELLNTIGQATVVYWDLYMAQKQLEMRTESVRVAEDILEDNRVRFKTGKMAEIEVLEAEAGVVLRKALQIDAKKKYVAATNDAMTLIAEHAVAYDGNIIANEPLALEEKELVYLDSIGKAFKLRPEYLATHSRLAQEKIRLAYAKNQRWPELDLIASYGLNGLDTDRSGAWDNMTDDEYYSWSVGFEFRVPLFGDRKGRGEMAQVKERKRRALIEMKAIEVALANAVNTTIRNIESSTDQARYSASVADYNSRLLEIELIRLDKGKSNSRMVLEKEEDYRSAREAELESLVNQKKAILELEMAEGSLLSRYHKDILKEEI